tara:strand:- start:140 stop:880 length:741 start_codon:yes stop_codon:yes gene_type:complete
MKVVICLVLFIVVILFFSVYRPVKNRLINKKSKCVFWTGGYDSTFCVLKSLLVDDDEVIPIYLSGNIDNKKIKQSRHNKPEELKTMNKIRKIVQQRFPEKSQYLKPLVNLENVPLSSTVDNSMKTLYYKYDVFTRPFNQYGSLAQASLNLGAPVDLGYHWEDSNNSTKLYKTLHKIVNNGKIKSHMKEYDIFKNLRFPIINYSKEDMLQYANDHNFGDIMHHTWSCWHPKDGKPCGKCAMCKERII